MPDDLTCAAATLFEEPPPGLLLEMGGTGRVAWVCVAALVAGCVQPLVPASLPAAAPPPAPEMFTDAHDGCIGYLLALLVDPQFTDPYLPPGFHLRDPKDFLKHNTVGTGQALALVWADLCAPTTGEPTWRNGGAGIYVQPPAVEGDRPPADYDLYEVAHFSPEPAVQHRLGVWEWPVVNTTLEDQTPRPEVRQAGLAFTFAAGAQASGPLPVAGVADNPLFSFGGATPAPPEAASLPAGVLRNWRDTPAGLAHLDLSLRFPLHLGSGYCAFQAGSLLAQLTNQTVCGTSQAQPNLVSTYETGVRILGVLQRGVHAK
jgi:hypothetical protein